MDEQAVQRELQKRDRLLFLDKEIYEGRLLYSVKFYQPDQEPLLVLWWHDEYGQPLPLTSGLVDKLDSLRKEVSSPAAERIAEHNRKREEMISEDAGNDYAEIGKDLENIGKTKVWSRKVSTPERARRNELERRRRLAKRSA
jgi:hypothetical protein